MGLVNLNIFPRHTSGKNANRQSRASGRIPGILYGRHRQAASIEVEAVEFNKALSVLHGRSVIFSLQQEQTADGAIALLKEVQRNPVTDQVYHIDLFEIPRGVKIEIPVPVEVIGESAAVKRGDANVALIMDTVDVSCLPRELPDCVTADITGLGVNAKLYLKDLHTPVGELAGDPDALVLTLRPPTIFVEEVHEEAAVTEEAEEGQTPAPEAGQKDRKADSADRKTKG